MVSRASSKLSIGYRPTAINLLKGLYNRDPRYSSSGVRVLKKLGLIPREPVGDMITGIALYKHVSPVRKGNSPRLSARM